MFSIIKKNYFLLISTFLILYFFFNLLDGERGLFSYFKKNQILINLQNEKADLINEIKILDYKNSLLDERLNIESNPAALDYIERLIREKFLFGKEGETLYIIKKK
jgi:cell division protein DivIC